MSSQISRGYGSTMSYYRCSCGNNVVSYMQRCSYCGDYNPYYQHTGYGISSGISGISLGTTSIQIGISSPKIEETKINKLKLLLK